MDLHAAVDAFFAESGPLKKRLAGYRPRAPQIEMAHAVAEALLAPASGRLAIEAGTGTGKSLAYLATVLLAEKRAVVTTGTKALQDQLFTKDVPLALAAVADLNGDTKEAEELLRLAPGMHEKHPAVLVKGRQNYLCKLRFERFSLQPSFAFAADAKDFAQITRWATSTTTGDRAELLTLPDPYNAWTDIDAGSDTCIGMRCKDYEQCFVVQMKRRAERARLVIANHHLLCADLRLRLEAKPEDQTGAFAHVLPDADAYIIDEAHTLPDVASDWFGVSIGSTAVSRMFNDVRKHADGLGGDNRAAVLDAMIAAEEHCDRLFAELVLRANDGGGGGPRQPRDRAGDRQRLRLSATTRPMVAAAATALTSLHGVLNGLPDEHLANENDATMRNAERMRLLVRADGARREVEFVLGKALDDPKFVVVAEPSRKGAVVTASPVDVASSLATTLFKVPQPVVMTSATLAVAHDVGPFLVRVGAPAESIKTGVLASPFEYAKKAALYCPRDMPEPDAAHWFDAVVDEMKFLLETTRGGALFLFTSNAALEQAHEKLVQTAAALSVPIFKQGQMQKKKLLDELRAHDGETGALLCATRSFWEGVDVRGRALRLVVMDRLPFEVPSDPLRKARADLCEKNGGNSFRDISLPEAALSLKQGAGRLLRDVDDAGIVAVLDGRLRKKSYGRVFLETLPPLTRIGARPALVEFWKRFVQPSLFAPSA